MCQSCIEIEGYVFHRLFRLHRCLRIAVLLNFHYGQDSYALCRYSCIYVAHMSPSLNRSSLIRRFEGSDAIKICNRITSDFYTGLPHICLWWVCEIMCEIMCENAIPDNNVIVCVWMLFVVLVWSVFYMYVCACMWMWDGG